MDTLTLSRRFDFSKKIPSIYQFSCMLTLDKCTHGYFRCMGSILVTNMDFSNKIYHVGFFSSSLLHGVPYENLKPGPRERSTSQTKRKLVDHKLEEKEGSTRNVGRQSTGCYAKGRAQQSREASNAAAKKVKTFCSDCDQLFCLECFNDKYYAME